MEHRSFFSLTFFLVSVVASLPHFKSWSWTDRKTWNDLIQGHQGNSTLFVYYDPPTWMFQEGNSALPGRQKLLFLSLIDIPPYKVDRKGWYGPFLVGNEWVVEGHASQFLPCMKVMASPFSEVVYIDPPIDLDWFSWSREPASQMASELPGRSVIIALSGYEITLLP